MYAPGRGEAANGRDYPILLTSQRNTELAFLLRDEWPQFLVKNRTSAWPSATARRTSFFELAA
jgi:hypothetical protein